MTVLLVLAGLTFGTLISARHTERAFAALRLGDSKSEVTHVMGKPKQTSECTAIPKPTQACVAEMLYAHPLAPVVPEYCIVRLDSTDHVIQTIQSTVRSSY